MRKGVTISIQFFGLLHLAEGENSATNIQTQNFDEQIRLYLGNAQTLSNSLAAVGLTFILLTNNKRRLMASPDFATGELEIREIPFELIVPEGTSFFSAHFKIDVFRYISSLDLRYAALCDLDMICLRPMPETLRKAIESKTPLVYEISDQVIPAYGHKVIIEDMESVTQRISEGRWIGGEFIAGPPDFFKALTDEIDRAMPRYFETFRGIHHVGDETLTSCAVQEIRKQGTHVGDAGLVSVVGRYWSIPVKHPQRPWAHFKTCFLLHLPADKRFLASLGTYRSVFADTKEFFSLYQKYSRKRKMKEFLRLGAEFVFSKFRLRFRIQK